MIKPCQKNSFSESENVIYKKYNQEVSAVEG